MLLCKIIFQLNVYLYTLDLKNSGGRKLCLFFTESETFRQSSCVFGKPLLIVRSSSRVLGIPLLIVDYKVTKFTHSVTAIYLSRKPQGLWEKNYIFAPSACLIFFCKFVWNILPSDKYSYLTNYARDMRRNVCRSSFKVSVIFVRFWSKLNIAKSQY
jgi:hypothetical protein